MKPQKLWTYDFTVITVGSLISLAGATLSSFAISLVVLDYTGSTFLYMLYNVCYLLPSLVCPVLVGAASGPDKPEKGHLPPGLFLGGILFPAVPAAAERLVQLPGAAGILPFGGGYWQRLQRGIRESLPESGDGGQFEQGILCLWPPV